MVSDASAAPVLPLLGIGHVHPVTSGGQKATYELYGALQALRPCRYVFLDPGGEGSEAGAYPNGLPYLRIGGRAARSLRRALVAPKFVYRDGPVRTLLRTARTPSIVRQFAAQLAESPACVFTSPWLWGVLGPQVGERFVVYDSQNFELRLAQERLAAGTIDRNSLEVLRAAEGGLARRADRLLACSALDAAAYENEMGVDRARIRIGFKGASVPAALPPQRPAPRPTAIFVGSDWPANNEAARFIAEQVAPQRPELRFRIVGRCCRALPTSLPANVDAAGFVDDLEHELLSATLALNPIFSGSGINMKLLEYLALGLPIVSSEFGVRGLAPEALQAIEVAPRDAFAAALGRLAQDAPRLAGMRAAGHGYALHHLDWPRLAEDLSRMIPGERLAARPSTSSLVNT